MKYFEIKAKEAIDYVYNTCRITIFNRCEGINGYTSRHCYHTTYFNKNLLKFQRKIYSENIIPKLGDSAWIAYSKLIKLNKIGNCAECAILARTYLIEHGVNFCDVMFLEVLGHDHAMLVLGRNVRRFKNAKLRAYADWYFPSDYNFIFCDPWYNECFTSKECPKKISYILGQTSEQGRGNPPKLPKYTEIQLSFTDLV